ncbi:acyltransferase domain-containing protein [Chromobacterium vaccinii]|uniref:Malonyl-CoA:ACP transacylase (MAT) domain-containing protein n=1 Tax=Chromobacterium vaccinii TaxID=1108595 RepID=A0A1D9LCU0_9NEIS|nr:acyltransferase domain-containing protein [Chromobacterium vaccinii]AOZ49061.1 hypothetical protein BKX93_02945 [Chromobacterium vaccinii]
MITIFMFSGQGSQYFQMGLELFGSNPEFRSWMETLDCQVRERTGASALEAIYSRGKNETFDHIPHTHPAIFMLEYALAQCLQSEGLHPDLTLGASMGSFAAAAVAGFVSVEDALDAVISQAGAFHDSAMPGGMLAVLAPMDKTVGRLDGLQWELAADNFDGHFALSAPAAQLTEIEARLRSLDIAHQRLPVRHAYHSRWIDDARDDFLRRTSHLSFKGGALPLICCEQADPLRRLPADFFWRAVRNPIRLRETIARLERDGGCRYIDVGPSGTMATFAKYLLRKDGGSSAHAILTPYGRDLNNLARLRETMV